MSVPEILKKLVGSWKGVNRLYTSWIPENPMRETNSAVLVELTARGTFLKIEYDWKYDEATQEGLFLIGDDKDSGIIKAFWIDSWHLNEKFMVSDGQMTNSEKISLKGFYAVPEHPDWGWRTTIETANEDSFKIIMYNVSPEGEEDLAVEMDFKRQ